MIHPLNKVDARMKFPRKVNKCPFPWSLDDQSLQANIWTVAALLVVPLAIGSNYVTIGGKFVFDDRESVLKNEDVKNLSIPITDVFAHDFWGCNITSNLSHKSYRPLTIMVFRIQHLFAGELDPRTFHMFSIGLHVINSLLSLVVITVVLSDGEGDNPRPEIKEGILLASAIFAVHPIHTESVASVVGQADMLYSLFSLKAFLLYHYALNQDKHQTDKSPSSNLKYLVSVSLLTVLSLLCKEQGLMTTVMCALYDILLHQKEICQFLMLCTKTDQEDDSQVPCKNTRKRIYVNLIMRLLTLITVTFILLFLRLNLMVSQPVFSVHDNPQSFVENMMLRVLNYSYLYCLNAWLLLNPWWLCCDWSNNCISILESFQDFRVLSILVFYVILSLLAFATLRCWNTPRARKLLVACIFLFVPFLPASNIFFRVGFVIAERNLYLPCLGFSLIVAIGYCALSNHCNLHNLQILRKFAIFLVFIFTIRSHMRNKDWLQSNTLFRSGLKVCPNNAKLYFNVGMGYLRKNELIPAKDYFYETIRKNPGFALAYNGLGDCYLDEGNLTLAEKYYLKAVNVSARKEGPLLNLCYTRFKQKKMVEAEDCINTIIREYPSSADRGYYGLGEIFYLSGDKEKALDAWIKATERNSSYTEAWESAIVSLYNLGRHEESEKMFVKALPLVQNPASLHHIWGRLHEHNHYYIGEEHFKKAIYYEPYNERYRELLVSFYKKWKRPNLAEKTIAEIIAARFVQR